MEKLIDKVKKHEHLFFSKKAGSFSGVPQRTVQFWSEKGLIEPTEDTPGGSGKRRKYNTLNCIQIAIVKALADGRIRAETISNIMQELNSYYGMGLPLLLGFDEAFLIIHFSNHDSQKPYTIFYEYFNNKDRLERIKSMGLISFNPGIAKTLIINISKIAETTINNMI